MITINFALPWIFLLMPLPWLVRLLRKPAPPPESALRVTNLNLLTDTNISNKRKMRSGVLGIQWWSVTLWFLLVIAAARPQIPNEIHTRPVTGHDWMLVFDVSASMETEDLMFGGQPVSRLFAAQATTRKFLWSRQGDRAGLIVFASKPWLFTPLSWDLSAVDAALATTQVGLAGQRTALGDAIGLAVKRLKDGAEQDKTTKRDLILITDGLNTAGELAPQQAAWLAQREGVQIHVLEIAGGEIPAEDDKQQVGKNDNATAQKPSVLAGIATQTGGLYAHITDTNSLTKFFQELEKINPPKKLQRVLTTQRALFVWPLGLAMTLLLVSLLVSSLNISRRNKANRIGAPS